MSTLPPDKKEPRGFAGLSALVSNITNQPATSLATGQDRSPREWKWLWYTVLGVLIIGASATASLGGFSGPHPTYPPPVAILRPPSAPAPPETVGSTMLDQSPASTPSAAVAPPTWWVVGDPAFVYLRPDEGSKYVQIPPMTAISEMGVVGRFHESRVTMGGKVQPAFFLDDDIMQGSEEDARIALQTRAADREVKAKEAARAICMQSASRPEHGEVLSGALPTGDRVVDSHGEGSGTIYFARPSLPHSMTFKTGARDVVVKVKEAEATVVAVYLHAAQSFKLDLPDGDYTVYFAQGSDFSTGCGQFMSDMDIFKDGEVNHFSSASGRGEVLTYELNKLISSPYGLHSGGEVSSQPVSAEEFSDSKSTEEAPNE